MKAKEGRMMDTTLTDSVPSSTGPGAGASRRRYVPVPHTRVTIEDTFWAPRLRINRDRTIPHIYRQCEQTGRIAAFGPNWRPEPEVVARGTWGGTPVMFWDSDVAKWIEAAAYSLATHPDPALDRLLDELIGRISGAQHADGYLNTWFTTVDPSNRWKNLRDWHELYCAGHLVEASVAHYEATGKRSLLDVVCRYADYIGDVFGTEPGKKRGYCGHPELELALVRLARATGEQRYRELSRYFVDERGREPHYFDEEARERGEDPAAFWARSYEYNQAHRPVREQEEVVGHAVRAVYLYSAMADLAGENGDSDLLATCDRLWRHLTTKRMYVMGGIGTSRQNEGFTGDYDLPNESAYAETCAAIGLIFWAQRMLQLDLDRRFADVLELALYNAVLSGVSADGEAFFYDNPLASSGGHHRQGWFGCPCCPPNLARLLASLGQYVYAQGENEAVVHLYMEGSGRFDLAGQPVTVRQATRYPWDGTVTLRVEIERPATFGLRLRIPEWCSNARLRVNDQPVDLQPPLEGGYARLEREWHGGDTVVLDLRMPVEALHAHPDIVADAGQVALRRGPLIYCLEQVDHAVPLHRIALDNALQLTAQFEPDLLGGVVTCTGPTSALSDAGWDEALYRTTAPASEPSTLRAIPYYAWDNREAGAMRVWIRAADEPER